MNGSSVSYSKSQWGQIPCFFCHTFWCRHSGKIIFTLSARIISVSCPLRWTSALNLTIDYIRRLVDRPRLNQLAADYIVPWKVGHSWYRLSSKHYRGSLRTNCRHIWPGWANVWLSETQATTIQDKSAPQVSLSTYRQRCDAVQVSGWVWQHWCWSLLWMFIGDVIWRAWRDVIWRAAGQYLCLPRWIHSVWSHLRGIIIKSQYMRGGAKGRCKKIYFLKSGLLNCSISISICVLALVLVLVSVLVLVFSSSISSRISTSIDVLVLILVCWY